MLTYEQEVWASKQNTRIAGIDEAGRGPLAGSVIAAAVSISPSYATELLNDTLARVTDSKKLTPTTRDNLAKTLLDDPQISIGIGEASAQEIDRINILNATHLAMARALKAITPLPDFALVDGHPVKGLPTPHQAIIKGDSKSFLIAAASIIAKTHRDTQLMELAHTYPQYHFERHKGYGTKLHLETLQIHGPCPAHRRSFRPVREAEKNR